MKTKKEVLELISHVKHPAIDYSLIELGIIKDVNINENTAEVIFAFPFPGIPIANQLINSIYQPIVNAGVEFKYKIEIMNEIQKEKFMKMEVAGWKG